MRLKDISNSLKALPAIGFALTGFVQGTSAQTEGSEDYVYTLEEFTVQTAQNDQTVKAKATLGAMRVATDLVESPITVSVLKPELLEIFQLFDPDEMGPFVAGWLSGEVEAGGGGGSRLRGFVPLPFRNGFERTGVGTIVNLDRVEIIKGPLSVMFGRSNPGGLINYVTLRPSIKPDYRISGIYGTYDYTRLEGHFSGPVSDKLFYRVDALYSYTEGNQDFFYTEDKAASTSWHYKISEKTSIFLEFEQLNREQNRGDGGTLNRYNSLASPVTGSSVSNVIGGINTELVKEGFSQYGPDVQVDREISTLDLRLEHAFDNGLQMQANLQWWDRTFDDWRWTTPQYYVQDGLFKGREPFRHYQPEDAISLQVNFLKDFSLGEVAQNKLLVAFDWTEGNLRREDWQMNLTARGELFPTNGPVRNLDPTNPDYGTYTADQMDRQTRLQLEERDRWGVLVSDRIAFLEGRLLGFASLRYENISSAAGQLSRTAGNGVQDLEEYEGFTASDGGTKEDDVITYSLGGAFKIIDNKLVFFASHSTSFEWQSTLDNGTGELQDNIEGIGYEAGFRGEFLRDSIYWTATAFQINRENIPVSNPEYVRDPVTGDFPPGVPQYIGGQEERSEGYEFEVFGDPTPNISFTLAVGYVDAYAVESGIKLLRAPEWNYGATLTYRFKEGKLKGLSTGISYRYTDDYIARYGGFGSEITGTDEITDNIVVAGQASNRIEEVRPSYELVSWNIGYGWSVGKSRHSARFNIQNLLDEEWWTVTGRLGVGREYRVSYSVRF